MDNRYSSLISDIALFLSARDFSAVFILADETVAACHPLFIKELGQLCQAHVFIQKSSEENKTLQSFENISSLILQHHGDNGCLLVNVGGGVICDLGGFVAATYKRGISFINVPTTLLAIVDAAVGGKNGVNLNCVKNAIGAFYQPLSVFPDVVFLETLPQNEILNGFGEILKYALIKDTPLWNELKNCDTVSVSRITSDWIQRCIHIKMRLVEEDFNDQHHRRILNFGHTVGHAIESFSIRQGSAISHGHAVALGICCEAHISEMHHLLPYSQVQEIKETILKFFPLPHFAISELKSIADLTTQDKKNRGNIINISLLQSIGEAIPNQQTDCEEIFTSLQFLFLQS